MIRKLIVLTVTSNDDTAPEIELEIRDEVVWSRLTHHVGASGFEDDWRARLQAIVIREVEE